MADIQYDGDAMICNKWQTMNEWDTCRPDGTLVDVDVVTHGWVGHFICTCGNVQLERRGIYHAFDLLISP